MRLELEGSGSAALGLSLPVFRSRSVLAVWQRQHRGRRLSLDAGPPATWGSTWSVSFRKRLPASLHLTPSKVRRFPELQGDADLDRDVAGPPPEVAKVDPVVKDPAQERAPGDLLSDRGRHRADPGDLAHFALFDVAPSPLGDRVADEDHELGTTGAALHR